MPDHLETVDNSYAEISKEELWLVENFVSYIAKETDIEYFYPTAVADNLNMSLRKAFAALLNIVDNKKLIMFWEFKCPRCGESIRWPQLPWGPMFLCPHCEHEVNYDLSYFYPVFVLNEAYRNAIKQVEPFGNTAKESNG